MSKKILIVSDSHGKNDNLRKVVALFGDDLYEMIHLGDSQCSSSIIEEMVSCPVEMVRGNCDVCSNLQGAKLITIDNHKALITHGHRYGGAQGIPLMREMAKENGADIVMFGHTHVPLIDQSDSSVTVLNPGSISRPRQEGYRPTYMVMTIEDDGRTNYSVVTIDGKILC